MDAILQGLLTTASPRRGRRGDKWAVKIKHKGILIGFGVGSKLTAWKATSWDLNRKTVFYRSYAWNSCVLDTDSAPLSLPKRRLPKRR
jgi:hypothetical protein